MVDLQNVKHIDNIQIHNLQIIVTIQNVELSYVQVTVCTAYPLFHHQVSTCTENVKFREVNVDLNHSVYFTEL